jgi:hypothetical protein
MRVSAACLANDRSESAPRLALLDRKVIRETVVMLTPFRVSSSHIINPRQQSDVNWFTNTVRACRGRPAPALRTRPGQLSTGTQASGKPTIFAHAPCFDRRRDQGIVDVAFAFASAGVGDFALSMFFRTPLREGYLLVSQVGVRMRWIARRRVCAESFWLANANVI